MMNAVIQRLDADAVAHKPQLPLVRIPKCNGKHAAKAMQAIYAPLLKSVQDDFRIGVVCLPAVASDALELSADLGVVVDLTVEDHLQRPVFVAHRLVGDG